MLAARVSLWPHGEGVLICRQEAVSLSVNRKADEETRCEMWLAYRELRQQFEAVELSKSR